MANNESQSLPIIEIPLKPANAGTVLPSHINQIIETEYAQQYLRNIHATPTAKNVEYLLDNLPLSDSLVVPVWTRELIAIVPGMSAKDAEATNVMSDIFKTKRLSSVEEEPEPKEFVKKHRASVYGDKAKAATPLAPVGRRVSWSTVNTLENVTANLVGNIGPKEVKSKAFRRLLKPLEFTEELVYNALFTFCGSIVDYVPRVQRDKRYYDLVCVILSSRVCIRLYGLLSHFTYWNIIHPCARSAIKELIASHGGLGKTEAGHSSRTLDSVLEGDETDDISLGGDFEASIIDQSSVRSMVFAQLAHQMEVEKGDESEVPLGHGSVASGGVSAGGSLSGPGQGLGGESSGVLDGGSLREELFGNGLGQHSSMFTLNSDTSLCASEKELLFIQIEQCLVRVHRHMGFDKLALTTAIQALVTCCHFVVDAILTSVYGWLRSKSLDQHKSNLTGETNTDDEHSAVSDDKVHGNISRLRLRRLVHQAISDILDPSRIHTSTMLEASMFGKHKPLKKATCRSRYYTTTVVARSVFGDSSNPEVTKFMNLASMEAPYVAIPGLSNPYASRASAIFHARKIEKALKAGQETKKVKQVVVVPSLMTSEDQTRVVAEQLAQQPRWNGSLSKVSKTSSMSSKGFKSAAAGSNVGVGIDRTTSIDSRPGSPDMYMTPRTGGGAFSRSVSVATKGCDSARGQSKLSLKLSTKGGNLVSLSVERDGVLDLADGEPVGGASSATLLSNNSLPTKVSHSQSAPSLKAASGDDRDKFKRSLSSSTRRPQTSPRPSGVSGAAGTSASGESKDSEYVSSKHTTGGDLYVARAMRHAEDVRDDPFAVRPKEVLPPPEPEGKQYYKSSSNKVLERIKEVKSWRSREGFEVQVPKSLSKITGRSGAETVTQNRIAEAVAGLYEVSSPSAAKAKAHSKKGFSLDYKHLFDGNGGASPIVSKAKHGTNVTFDVDLEDGPDNDQFQEHHASPSIPTLSFDSRRVDRSRSISQSDDDFGHTSGGTRVAILSLDQEKPPEPAVLVEASRSMVSNSNADVQISKKGKEQLMELLVNRAATHYSHKNIMSQFSRTPGAYQRQNLILCKR